MTASSLADKLEAAKAVRKADADTKKSEAVKAAEDDVNALMIDIGLALDDANDKIVAAVASKDDAKLKAIKADLSSAVEKILTSDKVKSTPSPATPPRPSGSGKAKTTVPPIPAPPSNEPADSGNPSDSDSSEEEEPGGIRGLMKRAKRPAGAHKN